MKQLRIIVLSLGLLPIASPSVAQSDADDDRGFLQSLIEDALSGAGRDVRIEGFKGALSSTATLEKLTIADGDGVWLSLSNAQLDWRRAALLRGRLEVNKLTAESLTLLRVPAAEEESDTGFQLPALPPPQATAFSLPDLPVSVQIGEVGIASVTLGQDVFGQSAEMSLSGSASLAEGEGTADFQIDRIDGPVGMFRLSGSYANSTDVLGLDLSVSEASGGLIASVIELPGRPDLNLSVSGEGPLTDFTADIDLLTDGEDRLSGQVSVGSTQDDSGATEQRFSASLSGDVRPLLKPDYQSFFGDEVSLDILANRSDEGGLDIETLDLRSAEINLTGQISLSPDAWPQKIDVQGRIAPVAGGQVLLALPGPETKLDFVDLSFDYDANAGDQWQLALVTQNLTRDGFELGSARIAGEGAITSRQAEVAGQITGDLSVDLVALNLGRPDLNAAVGPDIATAFSFSLEDEQPFRITDLRLFGDDYTLDGDLAVSLPQGTQSPKISADLSISAENIDQFAPVVGQPIAGGVKVDLTGDVIPLDGAFDVILAGTSSDLSVGIPQVDPLIAGTGLLSVQARRDTVGTFIDIFDIKTPQSEIGATAQITAAGTDANVDARIEDAGLIHPDMSGGISLSAAFSQVGRRLNAELSAKAPGETQVDLTLVTPEASTISRFDVDINSEDISVFAWAVDRPIAGGVALTATGEGEVQNQTGSVRMNGRVTNLVTGIAQADTLLDAAADFALEASRSADGQITVQTVDVTSPRVTASASGDILGQNGQLAYRVNIPNIGVLFPAFPGPVSAEGTVGSRGDRFDVVSSATGPAGFQAAVSGSLASDASTADLTVSGAVPLAVANSYIVPNIVDGLLRFELGLQGPLALPSVSGSVSTNGATLSLPTQKLAFSSINSTVGLSSGRANVRADLTSSTGGTLRVSGPVTLSPPFNGDLSVVIDDLVVVEPGLLETTAYGQILVSGALSGGALISGEVNFDEAGIQVPSTTGASSAALPGLEHRNEPGAVRRSRAHAGLVKTQNSAGNTPPPYRLNVLVSAPSRIFIRGRGLDAEMGGNLRLTGTTSQIVPTGRFELIRGRLSILGRRLDLTEGYIEPQGDLDPFMQIIAEANSGDLDVRFIIEGPISEPELTMTSSPELPEDEILSRYLFGRNVSEVSAIQALQITDSISQLSGRGPGAIGSVRRGLGLDDLDVETAESGETTVRAGGYLSENLYSNVSRTTEGETEINLNLKVTPNLTARGTARTDSTTSIGIFMEKDY